LEVQIAQQVPATGQAEEARRLAPHWRAAWAGYAAFAWVVVFFAFHVYWEFGGRFGFGDQTDPLPERGGSIAAWLFTVLTLLAFPVGALVALATVQSWGRKIPRRLLLSLLWAGFLVLVLRGGGSMLEDLLQATGVLQDGFTGLSQEQVRGPNPSAYTIWSARGIDAVFLLGGILFGATLRHYRRGFRSSGAGRPGCPGVPGNAGATGMPGGHGEEDAPEQPPRDPRAGGASEQRPSPARPGCCGDRPL
jgi:Protein of unknown function (DUF3995)